LDRELIREH